MDPETSLGTVGAQAGPEAIEALYFKNWKVWDLHFGVLFKITG